MPELRRPIVAVCMYMKSSFKRDAAACPSPAARRLLPVACRLSGRLPPPAGSRGGRRCLAFLALRHPHCSRLLPAVPASSCCSRLFRVVPAPSLPGQGRPEKVTAHPDNGCAADREYACRYSGSFPVPRRVLGSGPSHSSSRPPRANSSCGNQKLLSTRPLRRARWI